MAKRHDALARAVKEIGVTEVPAGSNWGPRVSQYLAAAGWKTPAPWCMAFVQWCFKQVGVNRLGGGASVGFFEDWAERHGYLVKRPFAGDVVCYRWGADDWPDHTGFVEKVLAVRWRNGQFVGWVRTIEGNTAVGNDSNGGKVMRRWRWISRAKFARIPD